MYIFKANPFTKDTLMICVDHFVIVVLRNQLVRINNQEIAANEGENIAQTEPLTELIQDFCIVDVLQINQIGNNSITIIASLYLIWFGIYPRFILKLTCYSSKNWATFIVSNSCTHIYTVLSIVYPAFCTFGHPCSLNLFLHITNNYTEVISLSIYNYSSIY
jgi:hypothetical protein